MFSKTRVAVLRGGPSSEYDVSLQTGAAVLAHLPPEYHALDVFIDRAGNWHLHGKKEDPHKILGKVDVVLNALHGEYGEDGQVQHLLETHRIPFSGSGRLASAFAMQKQLAKQMLAKEGIKTPYFKVLRREAAPNLDVLAAELYRSFPQPSVVKPVGKGSSLGVSVARVPEELAYALELAFQNSDSVLVEEYVAGAEAVCTVIEGFRGQKQYTLLPVEVVLPLGSSFLDYHGRYSGGSRFESPGNFSADVKQELERTALLAHTLLGLRHYSSSEFIVHPKRGIYFIEVDSLPPILPHSPLAAALTAIGGTLKEFLGHLLRLSLNR